MPFVSEEMAHAASALYYNHFPKWKRCNEALCRLKKSLPDWDANSVLIKVAAVDKLYSTNVYAIVEMADHISKTMGTAKFSEKEPPNDGLVEYLSVFQESTKRHISFASKFCHFFISEKYPIYDTVACETLKHFLQKQYLDNKEKPYEAFLCNLHKVRAGLVSPIENVELDRFLWLFGLHRRSRDNSGKKKKPINREAMNIFNNKKDPDIVKLIQQMAGCAASIKAENA